MRSIFKKNPLFLLLVIGISFLSSCEKTTLPRQNEITLKMFGTSQGNDSGMDLKQTADGGYILVGSTQNLDENNDQDVYIVKIDAQGNEEWSKQYGDDGNDEGKAIEILDDGYLIFGRYGDRIGDDEFEKYYVIRTDNNGDSLWTQVFAFGESVDEIFIGQQKGQGDAFLIYGITDQHINRDGKRNNEIKLIYFDVATRTVNWITLIGGDGNDAPGSALLEEDGFAIFATLSTSDDVNDFINTELSVFKINFMGDIVGSHPNTDGIGINEEAIDILKTTAGNYILISDALLDNFFFFRKTDAQLLVNTALTQKFLGFQDSSGTQFESASANAVIQLLDSTLVIGGTTRQSLSDLNSKDVFFITKTDADGQLIWQRTHGFFTTETGLTNNNLKYQFGNIIPTSDGGFAIVGSSDFRTSQMICFLKLNSAGVLEYD